MPHTEKLIVPGLHDSGPGHWQSLWRQVRDDCRKVELGYWEYPSKMVWLSRLDRAVAVARSPVLLVAHSLGCHAIASWAAEASSARLEKVVGALLVAPPDVDRQDVDPRLEPFAPTPLVFLPFRSMLVASRDDPYASFGRSAWMAWTWGSDLIDIGRRGHINADSGLGDWSEGQRLLGVLDGSISASAGEAPPRGSLPVSQAVRRPRPD